MEGYDENENYGTGGLPPASPAGTEPKKRWPYVSMSLMKLYRYTLISLVLAAISFVAMMLVVIHYAREQRGLGGLFSIIVIYYYIALVLSIVVVIIMILEYVALREAAVEEKRYQNAATCMLVNFIGSVALVFFLENGSAIAGFFSALLGFLSLFMIITATNDLNAIVGREDLTKLGKIIVVLAVAGYVLKEAAQVLSDGSTSPLTLTALAVEIAYSVCLLRYYRQSSRALG